MFKRIINLGCNGIRYTTRLNRLFATSRLDRYLAIKARNAERKRQ